MKLLLISIAVLLIILVLLCVSICNKVNKVVKQTNIICESQEKTFVQIIKYLETLDKLIQKNHAAICSNSDVIKLRLQTITDITDVIKMDIANMIKANNKVKQPKSSKITSKYNKQ